MELRRTSNKHKTVIKQLNGSTFRLDELVQVQIDVFRMAVNKFYDAILLDDVRNRRLAKCIDESEIKEMQSRYTTIWWNDAVTLVIM